MKRLFIGLIFILLSNNNVWSANQWRNGTGENSILGTEAAADIDSVIYSNLTLPLDRMLRDYRQGCKITYASASTLTVGAGAIMLSNSSGTVRLMQVNTAATTVQWANIDTGSEANSTTYYVWAFQETVGDSDFDVAISTSSTAPSGKTYYKRLGSFYNNSSGDIEQIKNDNDVGNDDEDLIKGGGEFYYIETGSLSLAKSGTSAVSFTNSFDEAPNVTMTLGTSVGCDSSVVEARSSSTTGFTAYWTGGSGCSGPATLYWQACGTYKKR